MPKVNIEDKTPEEFEKENKIIQVKSLKEAMNYILDISTASTAIGENPWTAKDVDKFATKEVIKEYRKVVQACRFFYRRDPLASVIVNKLIDIAITELQLIKGKVPDNQFRVYESVLDDLQDFAEDCALEFLLSGLLIPEVDFVQFPKRELTKRGIKTYPSLMLPDVMWLRDPATIVINSPLIADKPSYYLEVPDEIITFINSKGRYPDGTEDKALYEELLRLYPAFVLAVRNGERLFPLEDIEVYRRRYLTDSPYPTPYLYPALESLRHKRNIRRMDYSIASRVISAIMHIKVGSDEFPLTSEDDTQLEELRRLMRWRDSNNKDIERIYQLFTNHVVNIEWISPDTKAMLDDVKYKSINADILYALGMPNILITGENARSQSSDAGIAMISPTKTMENIRRKILRVVRGIVFDIGDNNGFRETPEVNFAPMNLIGFDEFLKGLEMLYTSGNISRTQIDKEFGYDFEEQVQERADENTILKKLGVEEFAPQPHSNTPTGNQNDQKNTKNTKNNDNSGD